MPLTADPEQLYHYTSFEGVLGITSSLSIWATSVHFLNDAQEFRYGHEMIRRAFERAATNAPSHAAGLMLAVADHLSHWTEPHVFVFSFSEVSDQLSQWRGYCPGGAGVSLGFLVDELRKNAARQSFELVPCVYDAQQQASAVNILVNAAAAVPAVAHHRITALVTSYAVRAVLLAPRLKHASFAEEREWRLISPPLLSGDTRIGFRALRTLLVPYFNFSIASSDNDTEFGDVVVGPNSQPDLARRGVFERLTTGNVRCRSIRNSYVPYRNL